jgi:serine/threonine protein kinase
VASRTWSRHTSHYDHYVLVLNTFTVGRYLDQIATALEYAHEHSVLHGSLSVDSIFIRLDSSLVVADFGVRSLLEQDMPRNQLLEWSASFAPEQLLGKPASPATDVYALGVVVYHLLTSSSMFEGSTLDEIAQQHLYASIPPLTQRRSDLPAGLYSVLARALAKDPAQRFNQPGAFANAYHNSGIPTNRTRLPFVVSEVPTVQTHQPPVTGASITDLQFTEHAWSNNRSAATDYTSGSPRSTRQSSIPHSLHGFSDDPLSQVDSPRPALMRRFERKYRRRTILIASLLVLLLIASSAIGIMLLAQKSSAMSSGSGQAMFFSNQNDSGGQTNSLHLTIQNLEVPPAGYQYEAWIINDQAEEVMGLGELTEKSQIWSLIYNGGNSNLLEAGDKLVITQEQGVVKAPAGKVILVGTFPVRAFAHVQHLLVSFPETPGKVGMLMGLLAHPTELSSIPEITTLTDDAYHGVDVNGDGQIDPVAGEAGALTAYQQGQLMATLSLVSSA